MEQENIDQCKARKYERRLVQLSQSVRGIARHGVRELLTPQALPTRRRAPPELPVRLAEVEEGAKSRPSNF